MTEKNQLQKTINRMEEPASSGSSDPVQEDYENGKKFLGAGDLGQAAAAFHNALIGFEQKNDERGIANASNQMGDVCAQRRDYESALKHFERAHAICERLQDPFSAVAVQKKIAQARRGMKQFDEAVKTYLDVLDAYRDFKNPDGAVKILNELAETYLQKGDRGNAVDCYRTAASIHANFKHSREAKSLLDKAKALEDSEG